MTPWANRFWRPSRMTAGTAGINMPLSSRILEGGSGTSNRSWPCWIPIVSSLLAGRLLWGDVVDQEDSFVLSFDGGLTWSEPRSTGISGQTMTPIPLGGDRLMVLYNRRYGQQGIVANLVTFTPQQWTIHHEDLLYDPGTAQERPKVLETGVDEFAAFQFGFPTAIRLQDGSFLATHWSQENGRFGIRWTKLRVDW